MPENGTLDCITSPAGAAGYGPVWIDLFQQAELKRIKNRGTRILAYLRMSIQDELPARLKINEWFASPILRDGVNKFYVMH